MRALVVLPLLSLMVVTPDAVADISGTVFRDINQNGTQNSPEPGVAGIPVRAYSSANVLISQTTSAANGAYTLTTGAGDYRIEYGALSFLEAAGGTLSSNVRFAANNATVNLALANPAQYCEAATFQNLALPRVQVAQFTHGQRNLSSLARSLATFPYNITPLVAAGAESGDLDAVTGNTGATWAVAHHRRSNYLLTASFARRHAELGPGRGAGTTNTGVIYVVDPGSSAVSANAAKVFADINQIAGSNVAGANIRANPVAANYNFFHDTGNGTTTTTATELFRAIGKTGLGGMDLSEDGNTLYVVSLNDRRLYQLDASVLNTRPVLGAPLTTPVVSTFKNPSVPIPTGVCANPADARPFASKFHDGFLYVGVTCTAESTIPLLAATALTGTTSRGDLTQLRAVVWRFNPSTQLFDNAPGMPANPVLNFSLNYPRGCIQPVEFGNGLPTQTVANGGGNCPNSRGLWQPWQPNWQVIFSDVAPGNIQNDSFYIEYPQPMLSDLEIDGIGSMILAIRDLNGDKVGYCSGSPNTGEGTIPGTDPGIFNCSTAANPGTHRGNGEGDILRACGTPTGGWTLESGGSCGGVTANNPRPTVGGTPPFNGQGPGNGEFYWSDSGPSGLDNANPTPGAGLGYVAGQNGHGEIGMGALALVANPNFNLVSGGTPGSFVVNNVIDARGYYDGGLIWFNNATGQSAKRIRVYDENLLTGGKSGGLGDLEIMCPPAPTQVGNRVWTDTNGNGIQDASETGINNVTVEIWSTANALLGRTTTNASGEWYINFTVGASDPSPTDATVILPNPYDTSYRVYLPESQTGLAGSTTGTLTPLLGLTATTPTSDISADGTIRDSNGQVQFDPDGAGGQAARIGTTFTLAGMGETDHSLDFGFRTVTATTSVNPGVTIDDGQAQCGNSPRIYNVVITNPATGSAAFTNLPFSISHPGNISPTSWTCAGSGSATCSAANGTGNPAGALTITSMPVNSSVTIAITVSETPACTNVSGNVVLTATLPQLWGTFQDTNMSNNFDDDIDVPTGDLSILLQNPGGQYCPGQTATFTLVVSNSGPSTAENVGVFMSLGDPPYNPGLTSWSRTGGTGTVISGASGITPALSSVVTLLSGQSVTYTIQAYVRSNFNSPTLTQSANLTVPSGFTDTSAGNNSTQDIRTFCGSPPVSTSYCAAPGQDGVPAAPISGVVNTYWQGEATTPAAGVVPGGGGCSVGTVPISVSTRAGAAVNVATGDLLMIIQMQDASIDSADSTNYGDGDASDTNNAGGATNYQNVGRYEYVRATATNSATGATSLCVSGAGVNSGLLRQYAHDLTPANPRRQTFQVVRVPQYSNVTLSDTTAVTALAWNGRRGGIVALDVQNQLSFNNSGSITVAGQGFRGGPSADRGTGAGGSVASHRNVATVACHNDKGEGLAGTPSTLAGFGIDYPSGSFARGAPGNAGGGGNLSSCPTSNNEEGGGGGGAACGDGGFGGRREVGGADIENSRGRGGGEFDGGLTDAQLMRNRLILGGGGGAGQRSSAATSRAGGAGGGIVILRAGSVVGTGSVTAAGAAGSTGGSQADGAGGGGGGGTVLIYTNPAGPANMAGITVNTSGGSGGATTGAGAKGSGGGGGAGCFLTSAIAGQLPGTVILTGGVAGTYEGATPANRAINGEVGRSANSLPAVDNTPGAQPGYVCGSSLVPVTLSHVAFAEIGGGRAQVRFTTAAQAGTLGFRIHGVAFEGRRLMLTPTPVMADDSSSLSPVDYQFEFNSLGLTQFMIEELALDGFGTFYGPYKLADEYGAKPQVIDVNWAGVRAEVSAAQLARQANLRRVAGSVDEIEVRVDADGIYRLNHADVVALGLNWDGAPLAQIGLTVGTHAVDLRRLGGAMFGPDSQLEFYGEAVADSLYTRTRVYRLSRDGNSSEAGSVNATAGALPLISVAQNSTRIDQARYYGIDSPSADPWYHDRITRSSPAPVQKDYTLHLVDYAAGGVEQVRVVLYGGIDYPGGTADHAVTLLVNGQEAGSAQFDGVTERELLFPLPTGLLRAGANSVGVRIDAITGFDVDRINIDVVELQHGRQLVARDQRLTFAARADAPVVPHQGTEGLLFRSGFEVSGEGPCGGVVEGCAAYRVQGFSAQAQVYRVRQGQLSLLTGEYENGEWRFAASEGRTDRYFVLEPAALGLAQLQLAQPMDASLLTGNADYLAIVHPLYVEGAGRAALDRLLNRRAAEGLIPKVVDIEQIYRSYSEDQVDPEAIRRYIADAAASLGVRYVVLVGGDSYDYFNYLGLGSLSFLPTPYRRTHDFVNFAPVDAVLTDLDQNGLTDLPIGRLPVRGAAELNTLIDKIERIEQVSYRRTSVHVADRRAATDSVSFTAISENLASSLDESWPIGTRTKIGLDNFPEGNVGVLAARSSLVQALGEGRMLTTYVGHSAPSTWSRERLLDGAMLQAGVLQNPLTPTAVVQFGCWGAYYVVPQYNTMAHAWLLGPTGAAVMIGSSGLTATQSDELFALALLPRLSGRDARLGDVLLQARREVQQRDPAAIDVIVGTQLLGDPAMRINKSN